MSGAYPPAVVAELERMVVAGLPLWALSPRTVVSVLNLSENATFALSDPDAGRELVLRVHRIGYSSPEEIHSELAWIQALSSGHVVDTAAPIAGTNGELVQTLAPASGTQSRHAVAFARLPGTAPDPSTDTVRWFDRLGEVTARMHRHSQGWSLPTGFRRKRWDLNSMVGPEAFWGSWRDSIGLTSDGSAIIEAALTVIDGRLTRYGSAPDRFGLVHADLHLANLLVHDAQLRVIDFDDCGFSWFMYDFATAVSFIEHQPNVPELLAAWVVGYRRVAILADADIEEIPTFVVLRRILLSAWFASHSEVPMAQQMGPSYTDGTVDLARQFLQGQLSRSFQCSPR